jgi:hypothetical protein
MGEHRFGGMPPTASGFAGGRVWADFVGSPIFHICSRAYPPPSPDALGEFRCGLIVGKSRTCSEPRTGGGTGGRSSLGQRRMLVLLQQILGSPPDGRRRVGVIGRREWERPRRQPPVGELDPDRRSHRTARIRKILERTHPHRAKTSAVIRVCLAPT